MIESMFAAGGKIKQEREVRYTYLSLFTIFSKNKTKQNNKEWKRKQKIVRDVVHDFVLFGDKIWAHSTNYIRGKSIIFYDASEHICSKIISFVTSPF